MHPNAKIISDFYEAFARRDGDAMATLYHPDVSFTDPVFTELKGAHAGAMWKMLTQRASDLKVEHSGVSADESVGHAHWEAWYTFSATGRKVHNIIDATFRFSDGKIISHADDFDFWRWSRQALGVTGVLLGWSSIVQNKVRAQAMKGLEIFESRRS